MQNKILIVLTLIILASGCLEELPEIPDMNLSYDWNAEFDLNVIPDLNKQETVIPVEEEPIEVNEFYCETTKDCEEKDLIHIMCVGEWQCLDNNCVWECEMEEVKSKETVPLSAKEEVSNGQEIIGLKGMRDYAGQDLKILVGEGVTKQTGEYAIELHLYDLEENLIDSEFFIEGDDESNFVNENNDRIVKTEFLVTNIYKRFDDGERYLVKIV